MSLKRHTYIHHPEIESNLSQKQRLFCNICGKRFYDNRLLEKHIKSTHNKWSNWSPENSFGDKEDDMSEASFGDQFLQNIEEGYPGHHFPTQLQTDNPNKSTQNYENPIQLSKKKKTPVKHKND